MNKNSLFNLLMAINILVIVIGVSAVSLVMAAPSSQAGDIDDPGICIPTWTPSPVGTPYITPPPIGGGGGLPTLTPPPIGGGATETPTRRK